MNKAAYTLHLANGNHYGQKFCGFTTEIDLARFLTLSVLYTKKQFKKVELFCDTEGANFAKTWGIPFTKIVTVKLPDNLGPEHWAYSKILTYSLQKEPFLHLDCDVILWQELSPEHRSAPMLFQNVENHREHVGYIQNIEHYRQHYPGANTAAFPNLSYNCGIVGANDLSIVSIWKKNVDYFLFNPEAANFWALPETKSLGWNHFFEQLKVAQILSFTSTQAELLIKGFIYEDIQNPTFKITHLWGGSKQRPDLMERIGARLQNEFPQQSELINKARTKHAKVFSDIYKENKWTYGSGAGSLESETAPLRKWLNKFIKDKKIKSVTDLGCGDLQFAGLLDLQGIKYIGIDCVDSVIETNKQQHPDKTFLLSDIKETKLSKTDLLIIKDVFIHWTNEEIKNFFNRKIAAKYILLVNDTNPEQVNKDISPGEFRPLDITKQPFNILAETQLVYNNKTVQLIQ